MFMATRQGNGPILLPAAYRRQYERRGWKILSAPAGYESVSLPTPLSQAPKVKPKRKRRPRRPKES